MRGLHPFRCSEEAPSHGVQLLLPVQVRQAADGDATDILAEGQHVMTRPQTLHRRACKVLGVDPGKVPLVKPAEWRRITGRALGWCLGQAWPSLRIVYVNRNAGYDTYIHELLHVLDPDAKGLRKHNIEDFSITVDVVGVGGYQQDNLPELLGDKKVEFRKELIAKMMKPEDKPEEDNAPTPPE